MIFNKTRLKGVYIIEPKLKIVKPLWVMVHLYWPGIMLMPYVNLENLLN